MEANETVMSSYYQHQPPPQHQNPPSPPPPPQPTNGSLYNSNSAAVKKRGRPRKYNTPEEAAAARRAQLALPKKPKPPSAAAVAGISFSPPPPTPSPVALVGVPAKAPHLLSACGNVGQGFTPHIISVAAGEDVYQKIMLFMQQSKREICILSASGAISNPFLRQPATSGGNVTYEGHFDILSLCGSYIRTDLGGRTGGLSVCLSSSDGQIIGGGVGGPLRAAGPVEVIVGTFLIDTNKDLFSAAKGMEQMV